jgi:hypothetical protein
MLALLALLPLARSASAQSSPASVLVCVPDATLSASVAPCPSSPVAAPAVVAGVVLSVTDYNSFSLWDGPADPVEGQTLAMTCAGTVVASYLVALGVGLVVRMIRNA